MGILTVVDEDFSDEGVDQRYTVGSIVRVTVLKLLEEKPDVAVYEHRTYHFLLRNLYLKVGALRLAFFDLGREDIDSLA